jgi:hypothetical protein
MPRGVDERREKALATVRLSDAALQVIAELAWEVEYRANFEPFKSEEDRKRYDEEERVRSSKAREKLREELTTRVVDAYLQGENDTATREAQSAYNTRSLVLLLVVLAVVLMPLIAMAVRLDPQTFGSYIAPVLAITGTVVGYWFGTAERGSGRPPG